MDLGTVNGINDLYARRMHEQLCASAILVGYLTVVLNDQAGDKPLRSAEAAIGEIRREFVAYLAADAIAQKWMPADSCCEGRPPGHEGKCWPLGGVHPAPAEPMTPAEQWVAVGGAPQEYDRRAAIRGAGLDSSGLIYCHEHGKHCGAAPGSAD
jgi:hypothetical protein